MENFVKRNWLKILAIIELVLGVAATVLCVWLWWVSANSVRTVIHSTTKVSNDLADRIDEVSQSVRADQKIVEDAASSIHAYGVAVRALHESVKVTVDDNQQALAAARSAIAAYRKTVSDFKATSAAVLADSQKLLEESAKTCEACRGFIIDVKVIAEKSLADSRKTLVEADEAVDSYLKLISVIKDISDRVISQTQKLTKDADDTAAAALHTVQVMKGATDDSRKTIHNAQEQAKKAEHLLSSTGEKVATLAQAINEVKLPDGIDWWKREITWSTPQGVAQAGELTKSVGDTAIELSEVVRTLNQRVTEGLQAWDKDLTKLSATIERARESLKTLETSQASAAPSIKEACDKTTTLLKSTQSTIRTVVEVQGSAKESSVRVCDQTAANLDAAQRSMLSLGAVLKTMSNNMPEACDQTLAMLDAASKSLESVETSQRRVWAPTSQALGQTATVLSDVETAMKTTNRRLLPAMSDQLTQISSTLRSYGRLVDEAGVVINLGGLIGLLISFFMIVNGMGLFVVEASRLKPTGGCNDKDGTNTEA